MKEEIIKEYLKCLLTDQEMKKEAESMANCFSKLSELEATLKSAKKQIESDMARVEAELGSSVEKYRSGFEMCNVDCRIDKDFQTNTARVIRLDTFEIIRERAMSSEERQQSLFESEPVVEGAEATTESPNKPDLPKNELF